MSSVFAERVKKLRKEMKMSQVNLGERLGVGRTTICEYEQGNIVPKQEGLIKLSEIFDVSVDYLTGVSDSRKTTNKVKIIKHATRIDTYLREAMDKLKNAKEILEDITFDTTVLNQAQQDLIYEQIESCLRMCEKIIEYTS